MLNRKGGVFVFVETPEAFGHITLRTWGLRENEILRHAWQSEGELDVAIKRMLRDGHRPRRTVQNSNSVENVGFDLLLSFLATTAVTGIQYVALGISNTPPSGTETQLPDEQIRIPVSSFSQSTGQLTVTGYFDTGQANITLGNAALFGNGATAAVNSGAIYSYVVYNQFTKNNLESLTAQWNLGFQRPS